jgi:GNAT superfamily N-acetyltransferase
MIPLIFALALAMANDPAATNAAPAQAPAEAPLPPGAPADDYQFVAWCYGALRGYLDMHDEVMPEVVRIESTFRRPGSRLADDLKVYDDQQRQGRADLKKFQAALTAAEKASVRPINQEGAEAVRRGRMVWAAGPQVTAARKAQEWMSWSPPARCQSIAGTLETRSLLMGTALKANVQPEAEPAPAPAPSPPSASSSQ